MSEPSGVGEKRLFFQSPGIIPHLGGNFFFLFFAPENGGGWPKKNPGKSGSPPFGALEY